MNVFGAQTGIVSGARVGTLLRRQVGLGLGVGVGVGREIIRSFRRRWECGILGALSQVSKFGTN